MGFFDHTEVLTPLRVRSFYSVVEHSHLSMILLVKESDPCRLSTEAYIERIENPSGVQEGMTQANQRQGVTASVSSTGKAG